MRGQYIDILSPLTVLFRHSSGSKFDERRSDRANPEEVMVVHIGYLCGDQCEQIIVTRHHDVEGMRARGLSCK